MTEENVNVVKEALTVREAAKHLGISEHTVRSMILRRKIPFYKATQRRVYFKLEDLQKYAFGTRVPTAAELAAKAELAALDK